jgi:hypothetical protein
MFATSRPFLPFDYLRVPYVVDPSVAVADPSGSAERYGRLAAASDVHGASLTWPAADGAPADVLRIRRFRLGSCVLHARVLPEEHLAPVLAGAGRTWRRGEPLLDSEKRVGSVWYADDGSVVLPFDPGEVVTTFWSEAYTTVTVGAGVGRARSAAMSAYYAARPLLPRSLQLGLRRAYSRVQARTTFPRWPVETSLHDFQDLVLGWAASVAGSPVPWIAPWPHERTWALVLTHDVETADGVRRIARLRDIELQTGHRSSWNFVPGRYHVQDALVAELQRDGFEVGVHGLHHDGRDLDPEHLPRRLPQMRRHAERWGATGFRSPATHRGWSTMAALPFDYDSSYPDTDPFEPQPGGCCSWLPFPIGPVVELPITLPQDHTLFVILRARDGRAWLDKAERIRERGGMALLITHPDYVEAGPVEDAYRQLLTHFADDPGVWRALPAEVARWWRRRADSHLEPDGASWRVRGPAALEASIRFADPPAPTGGGPPQHDDTATRTATKGAGVD